MANPAQQKRTLRDGEVLGGRFEVVRFIAAGGMGEVYEAVDQMLRERVALKTLQPAVATDPGMLSQLRREVQLARRVTHPNVCRLYDLVQAQRHGSATPLAVVCMELLDGETLRDRIHRSGAIPAAEAEQITLQIASGLQAAHSAGVVHRDFKSGNVLLVPSREAVGPRAVITDFGLAKSDNAHDDATRTV